MGRVTKWAFPRITEVALGTALRKAQKITLEEFYSGIAK
jgi:hypothetical protein